MLPWEALLSPPDLPPGAPEFSPGERHGCEVEKAKRAAFFCRVSGPTDDMGTSHGSMSPWPRAQGTARNSICLACFFHKILRFP